MFTLTATARYSPSGFWESVWKATTYWERSSSSMRLVTSPIFAALPRWNTSPPDSPAISLICLRMPKSTTEMPTAMK